MRGCLKYSVIIPVYNSGKTIKRCIDSLLNDIPDNAEILLINDGSTDQSGKICNEYVQRYDSISYYEKENGGVSSARNLGLDHAKGEYILFVDSDDYVTEDYWKTITQEIERHNPDMLQFGFLERGSKERERNIGDFQVEGELEVAKKVYKAMKGYMFSSLWARTFKKDIISKNNISFDDGLMIGEDQVFNFSYSTKMKDFVSISKSLYIVCVDNEESLSRKRRDYLEEQLMNVNIMMINSVKNSAWGGQTTRRIYEKAVAWVFYRSAYSVFRELYKYDYDGKERRNEINRICELYNSYKVKPNDLKCIIISYPIKRKCSNIIDRMFSIMKKGN